MLKAPKQPQNKVLAPAGTHLATCIGLIQVGTVKTEYMGEEKWIEKVRLTFELPTELHVFKEGEEPKPFVVSMEFSHSMGPKSNLRPIVEGIIGVDLKDEEAYSFDLEELLGKPCLITIAHQESKAGNKYILIKSTAPLMKGMEVPKQINPSRILTYEKWDAEYFNSLPDFIKDKMKESKQYRTIGKSSQADKDFEEYGYPESTGEIPF